jgi:MFS family permease
LTSSSPPAFPDPSVAPSVAGRAIRRLAAAFIYRDFRIMWLGAFTSSVGTWMQSVAQAWLVLTLTQSAFFLGLDAFLGQLPIMLLTLIGGVVADRRDRRRLLLMSQCIQMTAAFTLAGLVYWDVVRIWHILALSFMTGCAQAFGGPAYQSLIPSLVQKDDLPNAIALNSIQFNLARVIGPLLAGLALAAFGSVFCFTLNGLSFLVVIVAIVSLHVTHVAPQVVRRMAHELRDGLSYVRHEGSLLVLTFLAFVGTFLGTSLLTLLPIFAQAVFHKGVSEYSQLMAFSGAGAVAGALVVAWRGRFKGMGTAALSIQIVFGFLIVGFGVSRIELLSEILLFAGGAAMMIVFSSTNSLVQLVVPDEMRGRVMSIYMLAFRGGMTLGALVAGSVATITSAPFVLALSGSLLALVGVWALFGSRSLREI